ncbi:acyl carrier protein [Streptomyces alanosinicus]|nr:phosphopantetheine-binding protein [Streptomyces alanosinicus]
MTHEKFRLQGELAGKSASHWRMSRRFFSTPSRSCWLISALWVHFPIKPATYNRAPLYFARSGAGVRSELIDKLLDTWLGSGTVKRLFHNGGKMSENVIDGRISEVLKQIAELPESFEITADQDLKTDLNIDSLKLIDVVVQVEAVLDVELGDEFSRDLVTVGDLQRHVSERVGG